MRVPDRFLLMFDRSEAARDHRERRDYRIAMSEVRPDLDPQFALARLARHRRWSLRALIAVITFGTVWSGIAVHLALPADAPANDYLLGPMVGLFGVASLCGTTYIYDRLVDFEDDKLWQVRAVMAGALAMVTGAVLAVSLNGDIPGNELLMNLVILVVTGIALISAVSLSNGFHAAMKPLYRNGDPA
ncbi:hypothetical protein [Nocardia noduli]|uniref:hypothetical protein n=1 Tax=Nocardia noduli TaxID=2815722 RepID=UPI001C24412E|nr:hypothetical protein [Nocardia noduli]